MPESLNIEGVTVSGQCHAYRGRLLHMCMTITVIPNLVLFLAFFPFCLAFLFLILADCLFECCHI